LIDTHCHLLPGLDDGPREREESLLLAERLESVGVRRVVCTLFTERDRVALSRWAGSTPVVRIPFGTELVSRPVPGGPQDGSLLFIGNFVHPPNVDAARRLIESIFPRIRQRCPECELYIVGDQPPRDLVQAAPQGVTFTGRLPEIDGYLGRATVFLAPVRTGAGMRVKVVEALAAGKAVVASPLAAEGLAVTDGQELRVGPDDDSFVEAVIELLCDEPARLALGHRAREWAEAQLDWKDIGQAYLRLYGELLQADRSTMRRRDGHRRTALK